ncbi:MAG: hypothetical protein FD126_2182 [Elusimicrobia bacterium]|nr:MAG: hypothetical protein FD126_2182 [Elusimicrobiota bacterium]
MGWAGLKPMKGDGLPPTVPCPACGFAIPTAAMLAGDFDPRLDWATPAAVTLGALSLLYFRLGQGLPMVNSVGAGIVAAFTLLGAAALLSRLRR